MTTADNVLTMLRVRVTSDAVGRIYAIHAMRSKF